jgi:hypothetical protein
VFFDTHIEIGKKIKIIYLGLEALLANFEDKIACNDKIFFINALLNSTFHPPPFWYAQFCQKIQKSLHSTSQRTF